MKCLSLALCGILLSSNATAASSRDFTPNRIHYDDLLQDHFSLLDALEYSSGIVAMTNLPENFALIKKDVMAHLHSCLLEQQREDMDSVVAEESFLDGTVRRTLATATTIKDGPLSMKLNNSESLSACRSFEKNLEHFRSIANKATNRFAKALSREMEPHLLKPLLNKKGNSASFYDTIEDLVANGEVLEHFHSYQKIKETPDKTLIGEEYEDEDDNNDDEKKKKMATIDLHTDQGFFIAFTPGMTMGSSNDENSATFSSSDGFYIVEEGNTPIHVDFNVDTDDLVFMLGDGVNQYINNRLVASEGGNNSNRRRLRATPHAVSLKYHDESLARVWYGRMVLPPNDALVATEATQTTLTYGDVRRRLVETHDEYIPAGLGCSSPTMRALQGNLHDEASSCQKGALFCWARCMELSDYDLTEEKCEEQDLGLKCINPRGQFQTGERHGDFYPACTNTTSELTPYPEIPQQDEEICSSDAWETFLAGTDDVSYDHSFDLTNEKNSGAAFQWSVVDEENGIVRGRLVFGNVFGWLSMGFASPDGNHNGMNDGNILLALPGSNYTVKYGLSVSGLTAPGSDEISVELAKKRSSAIATETNPEGSSVYEYHINPNGSSFRHWSESTGTGSDDANVIVTDCFTAMTFKTDSIDGKFFNVSGIDDMMWAGNSNDYHVGYHGRGNRARFYINWKTGVGTYWTEEEEEMDHGDHSDHHHDDSGASESQSFSILAVVTTALLALNGVVL